MVKVGIIGIGQQGGFYKDAFKEKFDLPKLEGGELVAVCDIDQTKLDAVKSEFPEVQTYLSYIDMLDNAGVDMVMVVVPHYDHPIIAKEAMKRDIHVLVDKPAGVFTKEVRELNELAQTKPNLVYGMMFNQRMNPLYIKAKEIVDSGVLGELRYSDWQITTWWRPQAYYEMSPWRATWWGEGGGVLINQAPHQIDLWQWLCGVPKTVYAEMGFGTHRDIKVEDDVVAVVTYGKNNATGIFRTNTHDLIGTDRFEILGDKGKMVIEGSKKITVSTLQRSENEINATTSREDVQNIFKGEGQGLDIDTVEYEFESPWGVQHFDVIRNFLNAINNGEELIAPGSEGIKALSITNAMHLSAFLEKKVNIPVDEEIYIKELEKRILEEKEGK